MIKRLIQILEDTEPPKWIYIIKASVISFFPPFFFFLFFQPFTTEPELQVDISVSLGLLNFLLISPLVETFAMWLLLWALSVFTEKTYLLSVISGVAWGFIHGLTSPIWGLFVFWPFIIFSFCFLEWKKKSVKDAIIVTSIVHTCHNIFPSICLFAVPKDFFLQQRIARIFTNRYRDRYRYRNRESE